MVRRHLARLVIGRRQFDSKLVIGGHRLVTTPCDNERNVIYKTALITAHHIVQELCESRGGRPGLSVLTSLLVSVDVKIY